MTAPEISIDFGSSRTKIAYLPGGGDPPALIELGVGIRTVVPTAFHIPQGEDAPVSVGDDALRMAEHDPDGLVIDIKRRLRRIEKVMRGPGRRSYTRAELATKLFEYIRKRCSDEVFHRASVDSCVLTVPVKFSELDRECLRQIAHNAGFSSVRLIEEPVAAAQHWLTSPSGQRIGDHVIVVDIGGGTTDIACLKRVGDRFAPLADLPASGVEAGGNDIEADVVNRLLPEIQASSGLRLKICILKEMLARRPDVEFPINLAGTTVNIPRDSVLVAASTLIDSVTTCFTDYLGKYTAMTGDSSCPILLAGGGSRLIGMKEAIESMAPNRVLIWNEGDFAIVKGALYDGVVKGCDSVGGKDEDEPDLWLGAEKVLDTTRTATNIVQEIGGLSPAWTKSVNDVKEIVEDACAPFRLGIVGQFRTGKSSIVNALAGRELAYTDVVEATSCVTSYREGSRDIAVVHLKDRSKEEIGIDDLNRNLREWRDNPAQVSRIERIEVTARGTRLGRLELWDGPGICGSDFNEDTAQKFISQVSAAIWVLNAELLGNAAIVGPVARLHASGKPVVAVINRVDRIEDYEIPEAVAYVKEQLGATVLEVLPVSASNAITASNQQCPDERMSALRNFIDNRIIANSAATTVELQTKAVERGSLAAWRAIDSVRKPLTERLDLLESIHAELSEEASKLIAKLPQVIDTELNRLWADDKVRLVSAARQLAAGGSGRDLADRLVPALDAFKMEADQTFSVTLGWEAVVQAIRERLISEWGRSAGVALDIARAMASDTLSREPRLLSAGNERYDALKERALTARECDPNVEGIGTGIATGVGTASVLSLAAIVSTTIAWPAVLLALPVGLGHALIARRDEARKRDELTRKNILDLPAVIDNLVDERRAALSEILNSDLPPVVEECLSRSIEDCVERERLVMLDSLSISNARDACAALVRLQADMVPLMDESTRAALDRNTLLVKPDASGWRVIDRLLADTERIDIVLEEIDKGFQALTSRIPYGRRLRVLVSATNSRGRGAASALPNDLSFQTGGTIEARVTKATNRILGNHPVVLITDYGAWQCSKGFAGIGVETIELVPVASGRLAATRAFADMWRVSRPEGN